MRQRLAFILAGVLLVVGVIALTLTRGARTSAALSRPVGRVVSEPHAGIAVLPGYTFVSRSSIDTALGQLVKDRGPTISYEIGGSRAPLVQESDKASSLWNRRLIVPGGEVEVYMLSGDELRVGVADGNFIGRNVKTNEDVADVLLTALSLHADDRPAPKR